MATWVDKKGIEYKVPDWLLNNTDFKNMAADSGWTQKSEYGAVPVSTNDISNVINKSINPYKTPTTSNSSWNLPTWLPGVEGGMDWLGRAPSASNASGHTLDPSQYFDEADAANIGYKAYDPGSSGFLGLFPEGKSVFNTTDGIFSPGFLNSASTGLDILGKGYALTQAPSLYRQQKDLLNTQIAGLNENIANAQQSRAMQQHNFDAMKNRKSPTFQSTWNDFKLA